MKIMSRRNGGENLNLSLQLFFSNKSIVIAADDSVVSWGPSPTYGELVSVCIIWPGCEKTCL